MPLNVGDEIEFEFLGQRKVGIISQVDKFGYWVDYTSGCVGSGSIRVDFEKAKLLKRGDQSLAAFN